MLAVDTSTLFLPGSFRICRYQICHALVVAAVTTPLLPVLRYNELTIFVLTCAVSVFDHKASSKSTSKLKELDNRGLQWAAFAGKDCLVRID